MSATTTNGTAAPPPPAVSPVDYVRALTPEEQEDVFIFLIKELIRINGGNGLIPVGTETEELGYYVPPAAADARFKLHGPKFTSEQWAEIDARIERAEQQQAVPVDDKFKSEFAADLARLVAERAGSSSP